MPILPLARSLWATGIGAGGATALAATLKETKITELKCAPAPEVFAFVSAPVDTRLLSHCPHTSLISCSLSGNHIGAKGASVLAAILNKTKIINLKCAAALEVFAFVSAPVDTTQHQHPHSRALSLSWNGLGPEGGAALAEGLKGNTALQSLE